MTYNVSSGTLSIYTTTTTTSRTPHEGLGLGLGFREKSCQGQDFSPKIQATWLLYVYALLTVSHDSLSFIV